MTDATSDADELLATPVPALCAILLNRERQKGSDLTEQEVLTARDNCVCIMMPRSAREAVEEKRGYRDLDLEDVWNDWLHFKAWMASAGE